MVSVAGDVQARCLLSTILYGRPHGSVLKDERSSSQHFSLDLLILWLRAHRAFLYAARASSFSSGSASRGSRDTALRAWTDELAELRRSSVHQ